jgi:transglutaminase/protease-like cytokinesis protein 3
LRRIFHILAFYLACHTATAQQYVQSSLDVALRQNTEDTSREALQTQLEMFAETDATVAQIDAAIFADYSQLVGCHRKKTQGRFDVLVRSIYTWIATNISYDQRAYQNAQSIGSQDAIDVWKHRSAVCEGYANVFNAMCSAAGIESRLIKGYARDVADPQFNFPNHAWNSVMIEDKWYLVDVTWASVSNASSSMVNYDLRDKYAKHKLNYFFMTNPEELILTHLPEDPYWQLQNKYIDLATFSQGEDFVKSALSNSFDQNLDFETLISRYESLDSLDRAIAYLERMEANKNNGVKGIRPRGIGYYYKAQEILKKANKKNTNLYQSAKNKALLYYRKSLEHLVAAR